jgi:hypothetical protein
MTHSSLLHPHPFLLRIPLVVQEVLNLVVGPNAAAASSASKRYRMRCLKPLILMLSGIRRS